MIESTPEEDLEHRGQRITSGYMLDATEWMEQVTDTPMTPKQTFDGIVCLSKLRRACWGIGADVIQRMETHLITDNLADVISVALSHHDYSDWRKLADSLDAIIENTWDSTVSSGIEMFDWIDDVDCFRLFVVKQNVQPEQLTEVGQQHWQQLCEQADACRAWIIENAGNFFETEFYIERICNTCRVLAPSGVAYGRSIFTCGGLLVEIRKLREEME